MSDPDAITRLNAALEGRYRSASSKVRAFAVCALVSVATCGGSEPIAPAPRPLCIAPPSGIVSWWPGEGNASDVVGTNDGEVKGGGTFAPGKVGQAFSLVAVDARVVADADNLGGLQQFTVEVWVRLNALPATEQRIVTLGNEKAVLRRIDGKLQFNLRIDGELAFMSVSDALQAGVFHHLAGTYNGSAMKLFVDGAEVAGRSVSGTVAETDVLHFSGPGTPLNGLLDEVTVYDRALIQPEIQAIFDADEAGKCLPSLA